MHTERNHNHVKSPVLRWVLIACGWISVGCGVIGIFLPIVPTVPFLLLAAACFARSSERFHRWMMEHDHLGPLLQDYLHGAGIPFRAKLVSISLIWVSFPTSAVLFAEAFWLKLLLIGAAVAISGYLFYLPTAPPNERQRQPRQ
jgi:uncharacterized membrane protein YbaN (DUF454 family)